MGIFWRIVKLVSELCIELTTGKIRVLCVTVFFVERKSIQVKCLTLEFDN